MLDGFSLISVLFNLIVSKLFMHPTNGKEVFTWNFDISLVVGYITMCIFGHYVAVEHLFRYLGFVLYLRIYLYIREIGLWILKLWRSKSVEASQPISIQCLALKLDLVWKLPTLSMLVLFWWMICRNLIWQCLCWNVFKKFNVFKTKPSPTFLPSWTVFSVDKC